MTAPARTVEALRAEVEGLEKVYDEMNSAIWRLTRVLRERELSLLEAEDRAACPRANWIRALLAGDHAGMEHWNAAMMENTR